uniref:Uncharacterized protein n=1 Tax=Oryctolagus cuniculus TaxID=9986 RepID=A0A5F9C4U6_RABIT
SWYHIYKSFGDEKLLNGNRPSSAASAFKVPEPKMSRNPVNSARKPGSAGGPKVGDASKGGSGAVDKEDFIKAFTDVPSTQICSSQELEETLNKISEIFSDDKHDWDQHAGHCWLLELHNMIAFSNIYTCLMGHLNFQLGI